ncbi:MAG: hypothetical protein ACYC96_11500, partial [Fimbriimonadaceae bacterium]
MNSLVIGRLEHPLKCGALHAPADFCTLLRDGGQPFAHTRKGCRIFWKADTGGRENGQQWRAKRTQVAAKADTCGHESGHRHWM